MHPISRTLFIVKNYKVSSIKSHSPILAPSDPGNHHSTFCLYESICPWYLIELKSFVFFANGLFYLTLYLHNSFMWWTVLKFLSFKWLFCLPAHLSIDFWVDSTFWLLCIMLLWTWCTNLSQEEQFLLCS